MKKLQILLLFIPVVSFGQSQIVNGVEISAPNISQGYQIRMGSFDFKNKNLFDNGSFIEIKENNSFFFSETSPNDGVKKLYYENGTLKIKISYNDGDINGERKLFYKSGALKQQDNWKDGLLHGKFKHYYENGKVQFETNFAYGELIGKDISYGVLFGSKWKWDENGTDSKSSVNKQIKKKYYDNGNLKSIRRLLVNFNETEDEIGLQKSYYESGNLKATAYYNQYGYIKWSKSYRDTENKIDSEGHIEYYRFYDDRHPYNLKFVYRYYNDLGYYTYTPYKGVSDTEDEIGAYLYLEDGMEVRFDGNLECSRRFYIAGYEIDRSYNNCISIFGFSDSPKIDEKDLKSIINVFLKDCRNNNIFFKNDFEIKATFNDLEDNVIAKSYGFNNDDKIILKVDPKKWASAPSEKRWYILYHELGHDVLNLDHGEGGAMMFNFIDKDYEWSDFINDRDTMFNLYKESYNPKP